MQFAICNLQTDKTFFFWISSWFFFRISRWKWFSTRFISVRQNRSDSSDGSTSLPLHRTSFVYFCADHFLNKTSKDTIIKNSIHFEQMNKWTWKIYTIEIHTVQSLFASKTSQVHWKHVCIKYFDNMQIMQLMDK